MAPRKKAAPAAKPVNRRVSKKGAARRTLGKVVPVKAPAVATTRGLQLRLTNMAGRVAELEARNAKLEAELMAEREAADAVRGSLADWKESYQKLDAQYKENLRTGEAWRKEAQEARSNERAAQKSVEDARSRLARALGYIDAVKDRKRPIGEPPQGPDLSHGAGLAGEFGQWLSGEFRSR